MRRNGMIDPSSGVISRRQAVRLCGGLSVGIVCPMLLSACYRHLPSYRYRLSVVVETPCGIKSGSSVIEIGSTDKGRGFPGPEAGGIDTDIAGEAVPIEISTETMLFMLLTQPGHNEFAGALLWYLNPDIPIEETTESRLNALKRRTYAMPLPYMRAPVPPEREDQRLWPTFVTFRNRADPTSVVEVDPLNPAALLGSGVRIKSVTAQITSDEVDRKISKFLPWIYDRRGYLSGENTELVQSTKLSDHLNAGSFTR